MPSSQHLSVVPISAEARFQPFDLGSEVWAAIERSGVVIEDRDIFVISSKYAAISEGRMIDLSTVNVGSGARMLATKYELDPALAQVVLDESDQILGGIKGFLLTIVSGTLAPNAGVDRSNVPKGWAVQYPKDPYETARILRGKLLEEANRVRKEAPPIRSLGVILSDSRVTPTRLGTIGVAVSYAGLKPTIDLRGTPDLLGNSLVVTLRAVADQLATAAQLLMGESNEGRPIVLVRGFQEGFAEPQNEFEKKTTIAPDQCLIMSSLRNPFEY